MVPVEQKPVTDKQAAARKAASDKWKREAAERKKINIDRDSIIPAIIKYGGLSMKERPDIIRDSKGNVGIPGVGFLFSKNGIGIDGMVSSLSQDGYMTPAEIEDVDGGVQALRDKIADEFDGRKKHWAMDSNAPMRERDEREQQEEERQKELAEEAAKEAARLGIEIDLTTTAEELADQVGIPQADGATLVIAELVDRAEGIQPGIAESLATQHDTDETYTAALLQFLKENENVAIREPAQDHPLGDEEARPAPAAKPAEVAPLELAAQSKASLQAKADAEQATPTACHAALRPMTLGTLVGHCPAKSRRRQQLAKTLTP